MIKKLFLAIILIGNFTTSYSQIRPKIDTNLIQKGTSSTSEKKSSNNRSSAASVKNSSQQNKNSTKKRNNKVSTTNTRKSYSNKSSVDDVLNVSCSDLFFTAQSGKQTITIDTKGKDWYLKKGLSFGWVYLSIIGDQITVSVNPNTSSNLRNDFFVIKSGTIEKTVQIVQEAENKVTAKIEKINIIKDIDVNGEKGVAIRTTFVVSGMKNKQGEICCNFYDANGNNIIKSNGLKSKTYASYTPSYDSSRYTDFEIKESYRNLGLLNLQSQTLKAEIEIFDANSNSSSPRRLAISEQVNFSSSIIGFREPTTLKISGESKNKEINFPAEGGIQYCSVETNASNYEVESIPYWCSVKDKSRNGFYILSNKNYYRHNRYDWMKVKAGDKELKINIYQNAKSSWWKGRVKLGWNLLAFDMNPNMVSFRTGLRLRFGKYSDPFNLIIGGDYAAQMLREGDINEPHLTLLTHQANLNLNTRFNLIKCGKSKIYLGCEAEYGMPVGDSNYSEMIQDWSLSLSPQIGFNCKHFDIGAYWRKYLHDYTIGYYHQYGESRFGSYMIWYF